MIVNVSAIIKHENKVLLMQRDLADKHFPGHWGIPGGGMEEDDDSLEAVAIREVREELGINIIPGKVKYNNRSKDVIFIVFEAKLANDSFFETKLNVSNEVHDYEWVDLKALEGKEFTPFTKDRVVEVLKEL